MPLHDFSRIREPKTEETKRIITSPRGRTQIYLLASQARTRRWPLGHFLSLANIGPKAARTKSDLIKEARFAG